MHQLNKEASLPSLTGGDGVPEGVGVISQFPTTTSAVHPPLTAALKNKNQPIGGVDELLTSGDF